MRRLAAFLAMCGFVAGAAAQKKPKPELIDPTSRIGVVTRVFHPKELRNWRGAAKELDAIVWYPAIDTAIETRQTVGAPDAPLFEAGKAMPHAEFAPRLGGFPLIVLSHGTGGSAIQMAWLGTQLARAGYISVAVDHPGNTSNGKMTPEGMALWWERATDLSDVIDGMLADDEFGRRIDRTRIGAAGYSLGGYTVLELAGAKTDIAAFFDLCRPKSDADSNAGGGDAAVCHVPEMRGMGSISDILAAVRKTSGESLARSGESYRDPRVKAVFAMAPALGFTETPESLRAMKVPVEMVVGDADKTAPPRDNADSLRNNIHGARETVLPGVTHYAFLDECTAQGKQALPQYCVDPPGMDRAAVHAETVQLAIPFFDKALRLR